ncbi:uncharacterized protein [Ptychodera flava]|uniref:uncharacterized protein isoform X2 n=1 Tax=Ptychodera flava TaxID=63121 RepID=UPI00396A34F5
MAAYPSRPVFKPPKLVTEAEAKAYKTRDATKVYLGRSYPKWIDAKSVNYNQESNAVFSLHLLEIHRLFCRECNPLPHSERECTCLPRSTGRRSIGENWEEGLQSTTLIAAGLGQGIQRAGSNISNTESFPTPIKSRESDSSFLPLASSTPMQVKSCGQSVRIGCDSESEDTHTASEDEDEREFAVSFRTLGNDKNMSLEEVVFDTEQYGTDDNGAAEAGDDVTNAMDVIIAKKCLAFVPAILNLLKRAYGICVLGRDVKGDFYTVQQQ